MESSFSLCGLLTVLLAVTCLGTNITDCGSKGELNNITYTGCLNNSEAACQVERGSNGTLTVQFTPVDQVYSLTMKAMGIFGGAELPLPLPNPDLCLDDGITCPVPAYANQTYSTDLLIAESFPKLSAEVRWQIQDEAMNDIVCVQFPVQLV